MTGPGDLGPPELPGPEPDATDVPPPAPRPGFRTFSLDGRHAPGLYLVGWLASLLGAATIFVVLLGQPSDLAGAVLLGLGSLLLTTGLAAAAGSQAIERQAAARLPYRGPSPFLLFGANVALTLLLELVAVLPLNALGIGAGSTLEVLVGLLILDGGAILLVALLVVGSGSLTWQEMGLPARSLSAASLSRLVRQLLEGMFLAVPVLFATILLGTVLIDLFGTAPAGPLPVAHTTGDAIVNLVSGVVIAPFGEELFYRGFATTVWVRGMGPRAGIVRAALLFAVAHVLTLSGTPSAAFIAFATRLPVALALGWIFVRRGSLASSFGLHAMFNAIPLILVGLAVQG